jgi:FkbM family methyltransferase
MFRWLEGWLTEWLGIRKLQVQTEYLLLKSMNLGTDRDQGPATHARLIAQFYEILDRLQPTLFCDIGAYDGSAGAAIKERMPGCAVIAFEANPKIYAKFQNDTRLRQVRYLNLVVSDYDGLAKIYAPKILFESYVEGVLTRHTKVEPPDTGRTSLLLRNQEASYDEYEVSCNRLDDILTREFGDLNNHRIALWIDTEGAADKVLAGATKTLESTLAVLIEMETREYWKGQKLASELSSFLVASDFVPIARDREIDDRQFNIMFLHHSALRVIYPRLFVQS